MEYKASKTFTMGIDGRTVTGIFAVHGNVDDGDGWSSRDRSHPGMFGDFTVDGRKRAVFLWQHNSMEPPTATIDQLFEVARADLPPAVLKYAPDTTGGTAIKRTYLETARANEVFAALSSGALSEMSYSYDPTRLLAHAGAVEAAIADLAARLAELKQRRLKEGRTFSSANYTALNGIADSLDGLTVDLRGVLDSAEPKQKNDMRRLLLETQRTLARLNGVV
jgi:hypothetical protein